MVQYEMYFTNEYTEKILYDLAATMELHVDKKVINTAMKERDVNSLNNLLFLRNESGCICIDCNDQDWIFPLVIICHENIAAIIKEKMLKWDNSIRKEYEQELTEDIYDVYGKEETVLHSIEKYYGVKLEIAKF